MVFFIVLCGYSNLREEHISLLLEENVVGKLIILPDTLKIDGDQLKGESVFQLPNQKKQKVMLFYQFKTEEEKKQWLNIENVLEVSISGNLSVPEKNRNLNGFNYQQYLTTRGIY